jgi:hypothetical protein
MVEIDLTPLERRTVRLWLETVHEKRGHRGDGEATFPDEAIVEDKLDHCPGRFRITRHHLELVLDWAGESHGNFAFTTDELRLIEKIRSALAGPEAPPRP